MKRRAYILLTGSLLAACGTPAAVLSLSEKDALAPGRDAQLLEAGLYPELKQRFSLASDPVRTTGLGGLKPALALAQAYVNCPETDRAKLDASDALLAEGSALTPPKCRVYLAQTGQEVVLLSKGADVKRQFAPIESREEALSYVLAKQPSYERAGDGGQPRVSEVEGGYQVALYDALCTHVNEILLKVSREGEISPIHVKAISFSGLNPACDG